MIVAMGPNRVIGLGGKLPWHYPEDLKRFKRLTTGGTIIMGRLTHESIGRVLPGRRNIVVTRRTIPGVECFPTLASALTAAEQHPSDVWFIGGARIFDEAMRYADLIDVTYVPDHVDDPAAIYFPAIDETAWEAGPLLAHEDDARLQRRIYRRRKSS